MITACKTILKNLFIYSKVKNRIVGSILPWPGKNFVEVYLRRKPDLYGELTSTEFEKIDNNG